jgi:hypothetical protein
MSPVCETKVEDSADEKPHSIKKKRRVVGLGGAYMMANIASVRKTVIRRKCGHTSKVKDDRLKGIVLTVYVSRCPSRSNVMLFVGLAGSCSTRCPSTLG